ncbi:MAG: YadA-like family protein, partial [Collimonas sp.]|uniref:YadA family autotransporter adhesin n=1 Tax=Collimonas sp. TaxID=1963772 RepID=UPI003264B670
DALAVKYDDATKGAITLGGAAGTQIKNVADGVDSKDAVNVGQLNNVSSNLANATRYFKADGKNDGSDDAGVAAGSNSVAIGAGSTTTRSNVVEVGGRQISGLAAGTEDTDAVNVRQLKDAGLVDGSGNALDAVVYDAGSSKGSVTFAGVNGTVLNNVADGNIAAGSRQAVNGGQIAALRDSLQNQITNVDSRVTNLELTGGSNGAVAPDPHFVSAGDKDIAAVVTPGSASVGIGENAQATAHNAVAIGANSVADQANSVSVGSAGNERAIVNVADGVNLHDAANVGQMNNAINNSAAQTLQSANDYTDQRFGQISNAINDVDRHAQQGIAAAAALNNVTPYIPGKTSLNAGIAAYRGSTALGVTVSRWNQRGNMNLNAGVSSAGNGSTIVRAGVGIVFGN